MARQLDVTDPSTLLAYLLQSLDQRRGAVKNLLKHGAIHVNGAAVRQFDHPLIPGDRVLVGDPRVAAAAERLADARIVPIFEDGDLIVVDKPAGLLTVATNRESVDTLFVRLNEFLGERRGARPERAHVVHRLDRETSGLVLFAKNQAAKRALQDAWPAVEKFYLAIVRGQPSQPEGTISNYLNEHPKSLKVTCRDRPSPGARLATTHYRALETRGRRTLVEVRLETGRKHQIRVHLASLGCPVLGDDRYGGPSQLSDRLALHAVGLALDHPLTGARLTFSSPLPKSLRNLLA